MAARRDNGKNSNSDSRATETKGSRGKGESDAETSPPEMDAGEEALLTTRELMEFLHMSRTKIWELVMKDDLPAFKIGGDYRYRRSEVLAWLEKYRVRKKENA